MPAGDYSRSVDELNERFYSPRLDLGLTDDVVQPGRVYDLSHRLEALQPARHHKSEEGGRNDQ